MSKLNWWKTSYTVALLCAAGAVGLRAQIFTTVHTFDGTDGLEPFAPLVQAADGYLYGTTSYGGASSACTSGCGTIFKVKPSGRLTTIYNFCLQIGCTDGQHPDAGLLQAPDGSFYGATILGGVNGWGTIFNMTPSGALSVLYASCSKSGCADGAVPSSKLVPGPDGDLYGTTTQGGASDACYLGSDGCGTIYKMTPSGSLTTLYSFCSKPNCTDGVSPYYGALVPGADGNFYGTTIYAGGQNCGEYGCGTIFRITPGGKLTTLYRFCSKGGSDCTDGFSPAFGLVRGLDGKFYGATTSGGASNAGTVFKITASGVLTTLYNFCSQANCKDGAGPVAALMQATDGNFYGTTISYGGNGGGGTIFRITPSGALTTLYSFCSQTGCADGSFPSTPLVQDTNGVLYGATQEGGSTAGSCGQVNGCGTLFSLSVGLDPFVETQSTSGSVGEAVKILGTNLTGATSVTFNGTPAVFTVATGSLIKTTVPSGATTGKVEVVTPSGTLSSNVKFRVVP